MSRGVWHLWRGDDADSADRAGQTSSRKHRCARSPKRHERGEGNTPLPLHATTGPRVGTECAHNRHFRTHGKVAEFNHLGERNREPASCSTKHSAMTMPQKNSPMVEGDLTVARPWTLHIARSSQPTRRAFAQNPESRCLCIRCNGSRAHARTSRVCEKCDLNTIAIRNAPGKDCPLRLCGERISAARLCGEWRPGDVFVWSKILVLCQNPTRPGVLASLPKHTPLLRRCSTLLSCSRARSFRALSLEGEGLRLLEPLRRRGSPRLVASTPQRPTRRLLMATAMPPRAKPQKRGGLVFPRKRAGRARRTVTNASVARHWHNNRRRWRTSTRQPRLLQATLDGCPTPPPNATLLNTPPTATPCAHCLIRSAHALQATLCVHNKRNGSLSTAFFKR